MTRPLRLEYPGALWHIHNRGVEKRSIFGDEIDRLNFLDSLGAVSERYRWRVHSYTQMTNHFHLVVQTMEPTLSRGMQKLEGDYARSFNRRERRVGPLFQGRFRAHLVDSDSYLLELARYIVLNPVRAGMVASPNEWPWSSYRALAGMDAAPSWLFTQTILDYFDRVDHDAAHAGYRDFVACGAERNASIWQNLTAQLYLGESEFISHVESLVRSRQPNISDSHEQVSVRAFGVSEIAELVETEFRCRLTPKGWRNEAARHVFVLLAQDEAIATLTHTAGFLGMSPSGVHHMMRRARELESSDAAFAERSRALRAALRRERSPLP